jgi:6-phosphogluconate dehydrogenase
MQLGMIGLGRMGGNIVRRLMQKGHDCVVFDQNAKATSEFAKEGATAGNDLTDLVDKLNKPRAVWVMLPAGKITEGTVEQLSNLLDNGDIIIDGGNSFYKDDVRRAHALRARGIHYVDCGTSGGVWGKDRGYCLMIGGDTAIVEHLDPIFDALAPGRGQASETPGRERRDPRVERGYLHCGPNGAGRFVKMVHNGIEYGLMQAYAEGFNILCRASDEHLPADQRFDFDTADIAEVWRRGSVIGSWLLDLTAIALARDPALREFTGTVDDSGEGRWTVMTAIEEAAPADVLSAALYARFRSRDRANFADKILSAMRHEFGGHVEVKVAAE